MTDKVTVHMIGNAHIDPVWLWRWQEGYAETLATCRSALDRMNETPEFIFTRADASTYRWIEESNPEMFEEIKRRAAEGRWSLVGGWWEQPDCNIPSGESFTRHALYGKRYFLDKFGIDVKVGYNVDSFGHSSGLPQLLSKAGIDYYVFFRPGINEKDLPGMLFTWQGPDGSKVLACRPAGIYCTWSGEFDERVQDCVKARNSGLSRSVCFYGVGNHGGGPTVTNIAAVKAMNEREENLDLIFDSLDGFFEAVLEEQIEFPVVADDLQHHAVGCYSVHSEVKRLNRRMENLLVTSEKFSLAANRLVDKVYPREELSEAWKTLLFNQFHDILAGTSLPEAYDDVRDQLGFVSDTASRALNISLQSMVRKINTQSDGHQPMVVFNPHAWPVKWPVIYDENVEGLVDDQGNPVPTQPVIPAVEYTGRRRKNVFLADLPPFGYRLYTAVEEKKEFQANDLSMTDTSIENSYWKIKVDASTGWITSIYDKRRSLEVLAGPVIPIVLEDQSDTWSHGVVAYRDELGKFQEARVSAAESGPVRVVLRIESKYKDSTMRQELALYGDRELIECKCTVDWHEKHKVLKLAFPFAVENPVSTYDSAYSTVVRPVDGAENPGQMWVDVSGTISGQEYGAAVLNDSKYGFDVLGSEFRMTVLRSPIYAFHHPRQVEPGKQYKYMEQGEQEFTWALLPHAGNWQQAAVVKESVVLNAQPVMVETYRHDGPWSPKASWLELPDNVLLGSFKLAEDDDSTIIRLYEHAGKGARFELSCFGHETPVSLSPFELKTIKLAPHGAIDVDLIERT